MFYATVLHWTTFYQKASHFFYWLNGFKHFCCQFDEHVLQMGWFNHHPAVLCFLKHRIITFMNQGHLLQTPWQQLHKGTGATWRLKQSVPICRVFGSFKKWWFKKKPVFSPCFLCVISCYHWKKHLGNKGVMIYNSIVSFFVPTAWGFIQVIRLMDCWGGFSQGFLETYLPGVTKKTCLGGHRCCECVFCLCDVFFFEELEEVATATCIIWAHLWADLRRPHFLDFC